MADTDALDQADQKKRERSPSYPGINLGHAIDRAQVMYDKERRSAAPIATVVNHWGFSNANNGAATVALSALEKFGLIDTDGSGKGRRAKLTDLALTILLNPNRDAVREAVQSAALLPPIHRLLWNQYGGELPSDETLRYELIVGKRFSERGADNFISQLRATIAFAKLEPGATVREEEAPGYESKESVIDTRQPHISDGRIDMGRMFKDPNYVPRDSDVSVIPVLLPGSDPVIIQGKFPISEAAWDQLIAVLPAMKPGMVKNRKPDED